MIEGDRKDGYTLSCDNCGDECDELFETFQDAVNYKMARENGWRNIKDKDNEWCELCPACNTPDVLRKLKGAEDL